VFSLFGRAFLAGPVKFTLGGDEMMLLEKEILKN